MRRLPGGRLARALPLSLLALWLPAAAGAGELLVFGAASLADALEELAREWSARSGTRVRFSFAGSSTLARQIVAGAPADVFFSADLSQMDVVERAGRVRAAERRETLSNALVVVVPRGGAALASLEGLTRFERLALADPEAVPAGVYARRLLEARGLWAALAPKLIPTLDVRAALSAVAAGHAPAGIVYASDARVEARVEVAFAVPLEQGPAIRYSVAPIADRPLHAQAAALADFLSGSPSREAWRRHGFVPLE